MADELVKRLRDAAKMSEALAVLLPHSEGNAVAKLYNEAADAIEKLQKRVPLVPHGDLIDRREAIIDANERAYDFWLSDDEVNATIQFLKEQPTILPEEEDET